MKNKGITLIALIVTVIIMIILVSVSLNLILDGGIIDKARYAANRTQEEMDKETYLLALAAGIDPNTEEVNFNTVIQSLPENWRVDQENRLVITPSGINYIIPEYASASSVDPSNPVTPQNDPQSNEEFPKVYGNLNIIKHLNEYNRYLQEHPEDDLSRFDNAKQCTLMIEFVETSDWEDVLYRAKSLSEYNTLKQQNNIEPDQEFVYSDSDAVREDFGFDILIVDEEDKISLYVNGDEFTPAVFTSGQFTRTKDSITISLNENRMPIFLSEDGNTAYFVVPGN